MQRYNYIPIDYISADIIGIPKTQIENSIKELGINTYEVSKSGQLLVSISEHKSLQIRIGTYPSGGYFINLQGSLHKYWNRGEHNYNIFTEEGFNEVIGQLKNELNINPSNIRIKALEVGVNIEPPLAPGIVINHCFIHKRKDIEQQISNDRGKFHQAEHDRYILKIYDKGLQYSQPNELLRIEIKYKNWSPFRSEGIKTLADFIAKDKRSFIDDLIKKWEEVIFFDPTIENYSTQHLYNNKLFWQELQVKSDKTYNKHRHRLRKMGEELGEDVQGKISRLIESSILKREGVRNSTLRKKCLVTNIDISMQRKDSKLLSHTGLNYIMETNNSLFTELTSTYLTKRWETSTTEIKVREIAHTIRNKYNYQVRSKKEEGVRNSTLQYSWKTLPPGTN